MKRIFTLMCLAACLGGQAQTKQDHQPKMYRNENGRLFVNKHEPMYLFLGTDPKNKAKAEKLESESTSEYANPFYFDTEGENTIRTPSKVDPKTKEVVYPLGDIVFEVYADGIAPNTSSKFFDAPKYIKKGYTYYGKGLKMNLKTTDQVSGTEQTYISIDGADFAPYEGEKNFGAEKEYTIKYYAVDHVGNVEKTNERKFQTDITAPVVKHHFEGDVYGKIISGRSRIILTATDNITGVRSISYKVDDQQRKDFQVSVLAKNLASGDHHIQYWGTDNVKNESEFDANKTDGHFIVDKSGPDVESTVLGDQYQGKYLYVSNRSKLQLNAQDTQAGVKQVNYGDNTTEVSNLYTVPFNFNDRLGLQKIFFDATDNVNNKSRIRQRTVYVDNVSPVSAIDYVGPQFFARDTLFINKETSIKLFSRDKASGVQNISFKIGNGSEAIYDKKSFKIEKDGHHKIMFYAKDNVNNIEDAKLSEIFVDNIGPDIYVNFSIKPIRTEVVDGKTLNVYPPYVKMYLGATDKSCGTKSISYSINGGGMKGYTSANSPSKMELFTEEKVHHVILKAKDELGNPSEKEISFVVAEK